MPKRKFKETPPTDQAELTERFNELQDELARKREQKRVAMATYRAKLRTKSQA